MVSEKLNLSIGRLQGALDVLGKRGIPLSRDGLADLLAEVKSDLETVRAEIVEGGEHG